MTSHAEYFSKLDATHDGIIYTADSTPNSIKEKGDIPIQLGTGMKKTLGNVLLVPSFTKNLISIGVMTKKGLKVEFEGQQCLIKVPKNRYKVLAKGQKHGKPFKLEGSSSTFSTVGNSESAPITPTELWHKRYGHLSFNSMCMLKSQGMVLGIPTLQRIGKVCKACCLGKQSRSKFPRSQTRTHATTDLIHVDVCESAHTPSLSGHTYYVSFSDDYSRYTWVYFMKSKAEVFQIFKHFHMMVETMTGRRIEILRSNNGGEFLSKEFSQYSFTSRDVIFDENASFKSTPNAEDTSSPTPLKIDVPSNIQEEIIEEMNAEDEEHQAALRRSSRT
ncbi:hypothetical protein L7F22_058464 [Adiantum nelumboides]|nr:hypothetical protein [Adiantum nelumboides]